MAETEYDFSSIPDWPNFEVTLDKVSGRIPVSKMSGWRAFTEAIEDDFFNNRQADYVFRGQRRYSWSLSPSLGRLNRSGIITSAIAEYQAEQFARSVRGRIRDNSLVQPEEREELWSIGQHHGLHTPLIDFTYSPYVSLFFAFEKEDPQHENENPYRVVYVIDKAFVAREDVCPDIRTIEPRKDEYGRLVNQAGLFLYAPYDNTIENVLVNSMQEEDLVDIDENSEAAEIARYICKIYIANEDREGCLRNLRRMNVHHASLFPDLIGSSSYCNILTAEEALHRAEEQKQREKLAREKKESPEKSEEGPQEQEISEPKREIPEISAILSRPEETRKIEPGRIEVITDELESALSKHLVVDWAKRESSQARLRIVARNVLRRFGYPPNLRDQVIQEILDILAQKEESDAG
ncbi:FRG domain-containing protein [Roseibacillus ishigakijimensis]|uniref:FRG domain-containing protein n=1 Tax=Roseibacillus ishigakijimensis TaxID=454146 RepID=A0A934RPZ5_9BACT|nr:FRG domain-containing protein [Roseibacillus ishigakijimensis]MBK1834818.1 FRG domain-containing protein [Roseibacillus ishigakijimensis]